MGEVLYGSDPPLNYPPLNGFYIWASAYPARLLVLLHVFVAQLLELLSEVLHALLVRLLGDLGRSSLLLVSLSSCSSLPLFLFVYLVDVVALP